jgi:asparagine synthase (glutamine-hydrolysing)
VLAALVARATSGPLQTCAVGFADREANELPYARLAAAHVGAEHHEVTVTPAEFFQALPHALWHEDEPIAFPSSVPLYFLARLARNHVKVVLTGEGADELFLGYNRYRVTKWNARLGQPYWAAVPPGLRRHVRRAVRALPASISRLARRSFIGLEPGIRDLYLENFAVLPVTLQQSLLRRSDLLEQRDPYATELQYYDEATGGVLDRISRADLQTYLLELLMKQDQMSMAASIESRVPFLDDRLVEHVAAIPGDVKLPRWHTKALLRDAVRDLIPPEILTRQKMGFPVPLARWFREGFAPVVDEFVLGPRAEARGYFHRSALQRIATSHRLGEGAHADALWLLVNLEIWLRIFCDGEAPGDVMQAVRFTDAHTARQSSVQRVQCASSG